MRHILCCITALGLLSQSAAFGATKDAKAKPPAAKPAASKPAASKPAASKPAASKPATHTVKKGPFKIELSLEGLFEAQAMTEIFVRPKTWSGLIVLNAVEHGKQVKRGDLLVAFETDKIDEAIADLETANKLADLKIKQTEEEMRLKQSAASLNLAMADRARRIADEDLKHFREVANPFRKRSADFDVKSTERYVANQEEELRQLEKMYKADEITEETEEIVLTRARNAVEQAKFYLEMTKINHAHTLRFDLPRSAESITDSTQRQALASNAAKVAVSLELNRGKVEFEKLRVQRVRDEQKLKKLKADRAAMVVKSPVDGIVYYGQCVRGKWTGGDSAAEKLRQGGSISASKVFMTVVKPRPVSVRATVPESQLHYLRPGLKGIVRPTGYRKLKLAGIVHELRAVPSCGNRYEATITVATDAKSVPVVPGMSCKTELIAYEKKDALTVPDSAVGEDEFDHEKHYVFLVDKQGKQTKQPVTLGERTAKRVEILKGLAEGNQVLKKYPDEG